MSTKRNYVFIALALAAIFIWTGALTPGRPTLSAAFLSVGDGLCVVIRTPSGKTLVYDCGSSGHKNADEVGETVAAPYLQSIGVDKIDVAVLSHPHADHVGGFPGLFKLKPAKMVLDIAARFPSPEYKRFLQSVKEIGAKYRIAERGQRIDFGDGTTLEVLHPTQPLTYSDLNMNCATVRVVYKRTAILLTGDLGKEAERDILAAGENVRAQVLQVGHHGSNTASCSQFLRAVHPAVAVISCARHSRYGFPNRKTMRRLRAAGAKIYVTGWQGAVIVTTDGSTIRVRTVSS